MQLILYGGEELPADFGVSVVVDAGRVYVGDLLVKQALRSSDVADAGQQFIEVVVTQGATGLYPVVVQGKPLGEQLGQPARRPLAELRTDGRPNPVADCQDHLQVIMVDGPANLPAALGLNCQVLLDSCLRSEFSFLEDVLDVKADVLLGGLEKLGHSSL